MFRLLTPAVAIVAVVASTAVPARAQADPTDLARGLRENGHPDLALEFLDELAKKNPPPQLAAVLILEKARARLAQAAEETDEGKRDVLLAQARTELNQFLLGNSTHPRRAEGAIALARLLSIQAKGLVSRAARIDDAAQRKTEMVRARPVFQDAAKRFGDAAAAYAQLADKPDLSPAQKATAQTDVYQADLDRAINQFSLASTYGADAADVVAKGKEIDAAKVLFDALAKKDESHPLCWVAKAWAGECEREKARPVEADKIFDAVVNAARGSRSPAAAGARQVRFFRMRADYEKAFADNTPAAFRRTQALIEQWLADPVNRVGRPTAERYAAQFYLAVSKQQQARYMIKEPKDPKALPTLTPAARSLLQSAERDYRKLTLTENDYSGRAAERQTQVMRLLVGNADKLPAKIDSFDEALMSAKVQLYNALQATPADRAKRLGRVVALYERTADLPPPPEDARDAIDARVTLVYVYLLAGRPQEAAVLGEFLSRNARDAELASRAGMYALQAYLMTATKLPAEDAVARQTDHSHAAAVAKYLDERYPTSANTDAARLALGQTYLREGKPVPAFWMLAKVSAASPRLSAARLLQGAAAFEILRPQPEGVVVANAPTAQQKTEIARKVVTDLTAVPDLPATAPADAAKLAVLVELQIAELHILEGLTGYPKAVRSAEKAIAEANKFTGLPAEEKQELVLKAEHAKLRAIYAQAVPLFRAGKHTQAMAMIKPALDTLAKNGPANKPGLDAEVAAVAKRLDDFLRDQIIVLALQTRIGEGAVDKAGELFDLLKKLGGSADAIAQALGQLAQTVGPQVEELRKEGKTEEADKLVSGVGQLLDKVAAEPKISDVALYNLGKAMREMGSYDKAAELLVRVHDPGEELLRKPVKDLTNEQRLPVLLYRGARLELARAHRLGKQFDDAGAVLKAAMGEKEPKEKRGWAATAPDFRKEAAYLIEDKAEATADPRQAQPIWREALTKWAEMAGEYISVLRRPTPRDEKERAELERFKAMVKPLYHDAFYESTRCTVRANASLLKGDAAKLADKAANSAKTLIALENANPDMSVDVRTKFTGLLDKYPELKQKYTEQGGKMFLPAPAPATGAQ